jgi:hypothetical protein
LHSSKIVFNTVEKRNLEKIFSRFSTSFFRGGVLEGFIACGPGGASAAALFKCQVAQARFSVVKSNKFAFPFETFAAVKLRRGRRTFFCCSELLMLNRVTRLGYFFAFWAIFYFGQFFKLSTFSGYFFSRGKSFVLILTKMGWAIFSQTHRVTLMLTYKDLKRKLEPILRSQNLQLHR